MLTVLFIFIVTNTCKRFDIANIITAIVLHVDRWFALRMGLHVLGRRHVKFS